MEIVWTDKALENLKENLEFWDTHSQRKISDIF